MTFTKEQLIEQAKNNLIGLKNYVTVYPERAENEAMNIRLAEIALAALESRADAEPVAVICFDKNYTRTDGSKPNWNEMPKVVSCNWLPDGDYPVYLTTPPAPVVPDKCPVEIRDLLASHSDALFHDGDAQEIWNACRAAMLKK